MSPENDPLIVETTWRSTGTEANEVEAIDVYDRFSESKKRLIFALILWTSVLSRVYFVRVSLNLDIADSTWTIKKKLSYRELLRPDF